MVLFRSNQPIFLALKGSHSGRAGRMVSDLWGKVWGLNLPPKLGMLIWKVIHRIV